MAKLTHLPSNCSTEDIIEILERDGAAIVDGFVSQEWLEDFRKARNYEKRNTQVIDNLNNVSIKDIDINNS